VCRSIEQAFLHHRLWTRAQISGGIRPALQAGEGSHLATARRVNSHPRLCAIQRVNAEFRGSSKYASVHALREEDQSRRDDLWSVLYVLVDLVEGELPWTKARFARVAQSPGG
jgi:hypothetical protein